jgi:protein-tyrosine phosphatase
MGDSDCVLIEFMPNVKIGEIGEAVSMAEDAGYVPIVAHVERYACLYAGRSLYRLKKEHEVRFQVNCGTVLGGMGFLKTGRIRRWFADGLIDYVATDMHDRKTRRCRMEEAVQVLEERYGREYARRLTGAGEPLR